MLAEPIASIPFFMLLLSTMNMKVSHQGTHPNAFTRRWGVSQRLHMRKVVSLKSQNPCYNRHRRFIDKIMVEFILS